MGKNHSTGEVLLRQRIQQQVDDNELFTKKAWKNPSGPLFKKLRIFYCITAVYSFLVFLLNEFVLLQLFNSSYLQMTGEQEVFFGKNHWLVHSAFLLAIISFVFMLLKKHKISWCLQVFTGALVIVQTVQVFTGLYANQTMLGIMYLFALLPLLTVFGMVAIQVAYNRRVKIAVENEMQMLYNQYGDQEEGLMSAEEWDSVLENYEKGLLNQ